MPRRIRFIPCVPPLVSPPKCPRPCRCGKANGRMTCFSTTRRFAATLSREQDGDALNIQLRDWHVDSALIVPLIAHNQPVGLLCAYDKQNDAPPNNSNKGAQERASFHEEDAQLMRTFATQAAFVLHSARQYARAHDRGEHLAALARLTQVVNSSLELSAIVPAFLKEAQALVPYGRARLALLPLKSENESWSQEYPQSDSEETELLRKLRGKTRAHSPLAASIQAQTCDAKNRCPR